MDLGLAPLRLRALLLLDLIPTTMIPAPIVYWATIFIYRAITFAYLIIGAGVCLLCHVVLEARYSSTRSTLSFCIHTHTLSLSLSLSTTDCPRCCCCCCQDDADELRIAAALFMAIALWLMLHSLNKALAHVVLATLSIYSLSMYRRVLGLPEMRDWKAKIRESVKVRDTFYTTGSRSHSFYCSATHLTTARLSLCYCCRPLSVPSCSSYPCPCRSSPSTPP